MERWFRLRHPDYLRNRSIKWVMCPQNQVNKSQQYTSLIIHNSCSQQTLSTWKTLCACSMYKKIKNISHLLKSESSLWRTRRLPRRKYWSEIKPTTTSVEMHMLSQSAARWLSYDNWDLQTSMRNSCQSCAIVSSWQRTALTTSARSRLTQQLAILHAICCSEKSTTVIAYPTQTILWSLAWTIQSSEASEFTACHSDRFSVSNHPSSGTSSFSHRRCFYVKKYRMS